MKNVGQQLDLILRGVVEVIQQPELEAGDVEVRRNVDGVARAATSASASARS